MKILIKYIIAFITLTIMQIASADFVDQLEGIWEGEGRSSLGRPQNWSIRFSADNGTYKIDYPSLSCKGTWSLVSTTSGSATFLEDIKIGTNICVDQGTVELFWSEQHKLKYIFYLPNGDIEAFAELSCSSCNIHVNIPLSSDNSLYIPNFDSASRIVTFPQLKVDNTNIFINTQLFLDRNGSWKILAIEPKPAPEPTPDLNLTGTWTGSLGDPGGFIPFPVHSIELSLRQNGKDLSGIGVLHPHCSISSPCDIKFFTMSGTVVEQDISLELIFDDNTESLTGTVADDYKVLIGSPGQFGGAEWSLILVE